MRLAAQAKGGFYPCPPEAVNLALSIITPPTEPFTILDPCAGQGLALRRLADGLHCPPERVHAVELDEGRALDVRAALWPESRILAPASFLGIAAPANSFGYIWCNPPFDDEIGGGMRVEYSFVVRSTQLLLPHGILQLVCPEGQATHYRMSQYLLQWYEDISMIPFPEEIRQYREVIVTGKKRRQPVKTEGMYYDELWSTQIGASYSIPPGPEPRRFEKCDFTPNELARAIQRSPLRKHLEPPQDPPLPEPPLPLSNGHIALLLASGKLDGAVYPKGEPPHVVRGTARKQQYLASQSEEESESGAITTKKVYSEKIILTIRAVDGEGTLKTFEQE